VLALGMLAEPAVASGPRPRSRPSAPPLETSASLDVVPGPGTTATWTVTIRPAG